MRKNSSTKKNLMGQWAQEKSLGYEEQAPAIVLIGLIGFIMTVMIVFVMPYFGTLHKQTEKKIVCTVIEGGAKKPLRKKPIVKKKKALKKSKAHPPKAL